MKKILLILSIFGAINISNLNAVENYKIDPTHSSVIFWLKHMDISNSWGFFENFEGALSVDKEDLSKCSINFSIKANSVNTNNKDRDDHIRGSDFFEVRKYPKIIFKSTKVEAGEKQNQYKISGQLTFHGQTKEITAIFTHFATGKNLMNGKQILGGEARFSIKRSDFLVKYGLPKAIGDKVNIIVAIEAEKVE